MSLGLNSGDEIIMPSFNYVASAETAALLNLKPVFCDVDENSFLIDPADLEAKITRKTRAVVVVHLFGQSPNMTELVNIADNNELFLIEDNAQALGAVCDFSGDQKNKTGSIGKINTTSFFPTKTLGCYGDGGAILTNEKQLADIAKSLTKHGQQQKYMYDRIGCNSRLDTIQAAILDVKLKYLDENNAKRQKIAANYHDVLSDIPDIITPQCSGYSSHVYHQYVLRIMGRKRDQVRKKLTENNIQSMIYYPKPLHLQKAYEYLGHHENSLPVSEKVCEEVLAIPIDPNLAEDDQCLIAETIKKALR
jgi:dTDP-4-amino-4,6-dideoxygalactose transaminase